MPAFGYLFVKFQVSSDPGELAILVFKDLQTTNQQLIFWSPVFTTKNATVKFDEVSPFFSAKTQSRRPTP